MQIAIAPRLLEQSEAEEMYEFVSGVASPARGDLGIDAVRLGGGVALAVRDDPSNYWSKALGFGFSEPVTNELIAEVCAFYRTRHASQATVQIAPSLLPSDWEDICAAMNLRQEGATCKLACRTSTAVANGNGVKLQTDLTVTSVDRASAHEWSQVMPKAMGMPSTGFSDMAHASVGRPKWFPFAVRDASEAIVATATMRVHGLVATLFAGCTLPQARRRGAQSALIAARAHAAQAAGCEWLVVETAAPAPESPNTSYQNLLRFGFAPVYMRPNWVWRPAQCH